MADFFEPSIEAAVASIKAQIEVSKGIVKVYCFLSRTNRTLTIYKSVWLVGGFAASPWLFSQLQERLAPLNVTINRPDSQTSALHLLSTDLPDFIELAPKPSQMVPSVFSVVRRGKVP